MSSKLNSPVGLKKSELRKIELSELPKKIPNFKTSFESKDNLIYNWIKNWIVESVKAKTLKENELLPGKSDLAAYLGVSAGTVQNALRYVEDEGFIESKQRIGTLIKGSNSDKKLFRKLTSKREKTIINLKKNIINNRHKLGSCLPSTNNFSSILGSSCNTTRLALEFLASKGIVESVTTKSNESSWILRQIPVLTPDELHCVSEIKPDTLVDKVQEDLKNFILKNYKIGDKIHSHYELSEYLRVSIKTVHDAMKSLINEGILRSRRGRYGTIVLKMPGESILQPQNETTIFANAIDAAFYSYQKVENYLKNLIKDKYNVGDKLPAMNALSEELDISTNTIKKALHSLYTQGYVKFVRGRYGGTFISDIPEDTSQAAFKWLAVNPQYLKVYKN